MTDHQPDRRRLRAVGDSWPASGTERWLSALHGPLRRTSVSLAVLAVVSGAVLLLVDALPHLLPAWPRAPLSAAPLVLIGVAYISLQPLVRPRPLELLKRMMLGGAFILWGIDQLLPPGHLTTVIGDVVITLYVVDLGLIIKSHVQREDWDTP